MLRKSLLLIVALLGPISAHAHGVWFAQRATHLALIYGDGADDLDSVKRLPKFHNPAGFDHNWQPVDISLVPSGPLLLVSSEQKPAAVSVVMHNGTWSKTPDGKWHAKGRDQVPDSIHSLTTYKYAVHLQGPLRSVPVLASQTLQIVPVGDSFPTLLGNPVSYQVLYKGQPVAGAKVKADLVNDPDAEPVISDKDGKVRLAIRNQGLNVVVATYDSQPEDPKVVDTVEHLATLSYVLQHAPE